MSCRAPGRDGSPSRLYPDSARSRLLAFALFLASTIAADFAFAAENATPAPFSRLRDATLNYPGPSEDFTNLTEIRLGWFGPSAPDDPATGDLWWAANLAIDEANARERTAGESAFARLPFRLVSRWTDNPWNAGVSLLTRMVYDEQPLALLGSVDSASTHLAEQIVAKAQLPLVSPITTDPSVTLAGVSWMFACAPSDRAIARTLVAAVRRDLPEPAARIVLLATTDHESRMTAREVAREFSRLGRLPDFRFELPPGTTDVQSQLRAATAARPDAVLILAGVEDSARLVRAVRAELGNVPLYGGHVLGRRHFAVLAGDAAEGVSFPLLFAPALQDAGAASFVARCIAARGHEPDYTAALTYDATRLLLAAIHRAGPNRARIREALTQLSPWTGVAGVIEFDGTGQNRRDDLPLGVIQRGAIIPLPSTPPPVGAPLAAPSPSFVPGLQGAATGAPASTLQRDCGPGRDGCPSLDPHQIPNAPEKPPRRNLALLPSP